MKKVIVLILVIVGIVWLGSCRKDVLVPQLPSLSGIYKGTYSVQDGDQVPEVQNIKWTFRTSSYTYALDTSAIPKTPRRFCDAYGSYDLTSGVDLTQDPAWQSKDVCNADKNPTGLFQRFISNDTILILRQQEGRIAKEINLKKTL